MPDVRCEDVLADFVHDLRQPLSALEALASYLDLIAPQDPRIHEHLRAMHVQLGQAEQILFEGARVLRACVPYAGHSKPEPAMPHDEVVEELACPLTSAAMASVT